MQHIHPPFFVIYPLQIQVTIPHREDNSGADLCPFHGCLSAVINEFWQTRPPTQPPGSVAVQNIGNS